MFANVLAPLRSARSAACRCASVRRSGRPAAAWHYLLGTDQLGRDVLSRLIFGARVSMVVGFTAVIFAGVIGTALGILSGYLGGWVDQVIMRVDRHLARLAGADLRDLPRRDRRPERCGTSSSSSGVVYWTRYARVIRGEVLSLKEREFVRLAIVAGCSKWTIMRRHILPNVINSADRARHPDAGRGDRHRGGAVVPRRRRAAAASRPGA